jgi:hypothetical protein
MLTELLFRAFSDSCQDAAEAGMALERTQQRFYRDRPAREQIRLDFEQALEGVEGLFGRTGRDALERFGQAGVGNAAASREVGNRLPGARPLQVGLFGLPGVGERDREADV